MFQVLFTVLATQQRYGGKEARLTADNIAEMTGLSMATVKRALGKLTAANLLARPSRRGSLRVVFPTVRVNESTAPPRIPGTASRPNFKEIARTGGGEMGFTSKQQKLIDDVFMEASEILGSDARKLTIQTKAAEKLGLGSGVSFAEALTAVKQSGDKLTARNLVSAVLALRKDERVQGQDLDVTCKDTF